jgi:hypothetical protein
MGALSVSFLHDVEDDITHVNQINPYIDFRVKNDSVLSIIIANLYLYLTGERSWDECEQKMEQCIGDNLGPDIHFSLVPEDNKIPLRPEFLALLEQLFFAMELDYRDVKSLAFELEEFFSEKNQGPPKVDHLLALPAFRRIFVDGSGFLTKKWQIFVENVTCQDTGALALCGLGSELLGAVCALEGWRIDDAKAALQNISFEASNNVFAELHSRGCAVRDPGLFRDKSCCFNLTTRICAGEVKLVKKYVIKYNPFSDWCGFPFEIIPVT